MAIYIGDKQIPEYITYNKSTYKSHTINNTTTKLMTTVIDNSQVYVDKGCLTNFAGFGTTVADLWPARDDTDDWTIYIRVKTPSSWADGTANVFSSSDISTYKAFVTAVLSTKWTIYAADGIGHSGSTTVSTSTWYWLKLTFSSTQFTLSSFEDYGIYTYENIAESTEWSDTITVTKSDSIQNYDTNVNVGNGDGTYVRRWTDGYIDLFNSYKVNETTGVKYFFMGYYAQSAARINGNSSINILKKSYSSGFYDFSTSNYISIRKGDIFAYPIELRFSFMLYNMPTESCVLIHGEKIAQCDINADGSQVYYYYSYPNYYNNTDYTIEAGVLYDFKFTVEYNSGYKASYYIKNLSAGDTEWTLLNSGTLSSTPSSTSYDFNIGISSYSPSDTYAFTGEVYINTAYISYGGTKYHLWNPSHSYEMDFFQAFDGKVRAIAVGESLCFGTPPSSSYDLNLTADGTVGGDTRAVSYTPACTSSGYMAFTGNSSDYFEWDNSSFPTSLTFIYYDPDGFIFSSCNVVSSGGYYLSSCVLSGSNDGENYTSITSDTGTNANSLYLADLANLKKYKYYKFVITPSSSAVKPKLRITNMRSL